MKAWPFSGTGDTSVHTSNKRAGGLQSIKGIHTDMCVCVCVISDGDREKEKRKGDKD